MDFNIKKLTKIIVYLVVTLLSLNMINAVEIVPGFQYGGDMISDGTYLYVSDSGNNAVLVFNQMSGELINLIAVGSMPKDLLLEGNKLYIAVSGSSKISVIDITTDSVIDTYSLNFKPKSIAKKGNYLYILEDNSQWAAYPTIYDISTKTQIGKLPQYQTGNAPIYSPNYIQIVGNNLYFSETGLSSSSVFEYDISNPTSPTFIKKSGFNDFTNIWDFDVDPQTGLFYVVHGRELTVTDSNFVIKNSLKDVSYSSGLDGDALFTYEGFYNKNLKISNSTNMLPLGTIDLSYYNLFFVDSNGIYLKDGQLFVIGKDSSNQKPMLISMFIFNNTLYLGDFLNDYSYDVELSNSEFIYDGVSASLNVEIKNKGVNDIDTSNLEISSNLLSGGNYKLNLYGPTTIPAGSSQVFTLTPNVPGYGEYDLNVSLIVNKPYIDLNETDNNFSSKITIQNPNPVTKPTSVPTPQQTSSPKQSIQNPVAEKSPVVIIDNSVNNVNVDNSVNTINIANTTINANTNTNLNTMVNSSIGLVDSKKEEVQTNSKNIKSNDQGKVKVEDKNDTNKLKNTCKKDNINYDVGIRLYSAQNPTYCDTDNLFKVQKDIGSVCQNNFECATNTCSSGVCTDINAKLDSQTNLLQQILDWLKSVFGGKN